MSTELPVEVLPKETPIPHGEEPRRLTRPHFSTKRLTLAFTIAALADVCSFFLALTPPVQWAVDLVTALLLFVVLGWQWILLPGLIMEAIPGFYVFPFWVLVAGAVTLWGTARPDRARIGHLFASLRPMRYSRRAKKNLQWENVQQGRRDDTSS